MPYKAGSAFVSVVPSFRGWQTKVAAFTKSNLRAIEIPATVKIDEKRATADVKAATARVASKASSKAKVDVDTSPALRALTKLERRLDRLSRGRTLINAAVAASPLAVPVAAGAVGALGAGAAIAAPAAAGIGGFAAIGGAQMSRITERQKAGLPLSDQQDKAAAATDRLSASWNRFLTLTEKPVLGALIGGMSALSKAMPALANFISPVASGFGRMFDAFGNAAATKGFQAFSTTFGTFASKILGDATEGILNLARGFGDLFLAFMPLGTDMSSGLVGLTAKFAKWSSTVGESKGFRSFIDYVRENGPILLSTLGGLVMAVVKVGIALAPMAAAMLRGVGAFATWLGNLAESHPWLIRIIAGVVLFSAGLAAVARPLAALIGAVKTFTIVFKILGAVFLTNPIGMVVTILGLLVIGFIQAYKRSETFRNIVNGAWAGIKKAAGATWEFLKTTFGHLKAGVGRVGDSFESMRDAITGAWSWIKTKTNQAALWLVEKVLWLAEKILGAMVKAFGWAGPMGEKLKDALGEVKDFRKDVNKELDDIRDEPVKVSLTARALKLTGIEAKMFGGAGGAGKRHGAGGMGGPSISASTSGLPKAIGTTRSNVSAFNATFSERVSQRLSKFLESMPGGVGPKGRVMRRGSYSIGMPYLGYPGHFGADYPASTGTPVYAMSSGLVQRAMSMAGSYGRHVFLGHPGGVQTRYAHMSRLNVKPGQRVMAGQQIGAVGSTGNSTGPHLHFEYRRGGRPVNPAGLGIFDSGGMLPPGLSTVFNGTGKPEPVMTGGQFDSLSKLASKGASTSGRLTITNWEKGTAYFESIADGVAGGREDLTATAGRMG